MFERSTALRALFVVALLVALGLRIAVDLVPPQSGAVRPKVNSGEIVMRLRASSNEHFSSDALPIDVPFDREL